MTGWAYADIFETIAEIDPGRPALLHGDLIRDWKSFDERADGLAQFLLDSGCEHQQRVAFLLYNRPEYLEMFAACSKASLVHVNTNYRYTHDELKHIWDDSDSVAVVFQGAFTDTVDSIREAATGVRIWLFVDDGKAQCPDWATPYEEAVKTPNEGRVRSPQGRSGDDLFFMYTGGTTGMPKGVMWRQDDVLMNIDRSNRQALPEHSDLDDSGYSEVVAARSQKPGPLSLPACPLMHGTGLFSALNTLILGGSIVTLESTKFDVIEFWDLIERHGVKSTFIVGDAFAQPLLGALEANPGRWDISSLRVIFSSGVMWSEENKAGFLAQSDRLMLVDSYGSSEAVGAAASISSKTATAGTAKFEMGETTIVIDENNQPIAPGSGEIGRLGLKGRTPVGYHKDPEKSAKTFPVVDGIRFSVPGDFATVSAEGEITLLGRGSVCINTGGEKVFPEEVEEALKTFDGVKDAIVVGVPDPRFGQRIASVVQSDRLSDDTTADLVAHVKVSLAEYKAPRAIYYVSDLERAANGKIDYSRWTKYCEERAS